jgi:hypothetical protein
LASALRFESFAENFGIYGVHKVRCQLGSEDTPAAGCTVPRLMRALGLRRVVRGKEARTTMPSKAAPCPADASSSRSLISHPPKPRNAVMPHRRHLA